MRKRVTLYPRLIATLLLAAIIAIGVPPQFNAYTAQAAQPITVTVDGESVIFETPPQIINGRVMVQIRAIVEMLGCSVVWDGDTQTSYINKPNVPLQRTAQRGNNINVFVNNQQINFPDQQPVNYSGYILIPSRGVIEALGYSTVWDSSTQTQIIVTEGNAEVPSPSAESPQTPTEHRTQIPTPTQILQSSAAPEQAQAAFIGNRNSQVFHRPTCGTLPAPQNRINFASRQEAVNAGHRPCRRCSP